VKINSIWWERLPPDQKFGFLALAGCAIAGLVAVIVYAVI